MGGGCRKKGMEGRRGRRGQDPTALKESGCKGRPAPVLRNRSAAPGAGDSAASEQEGDAARSILETGREPQFSWEWDGNLSCGRWGADAQGPNPGPSLRLGACRCLGKAPSKAAGHKHPCCTVCLLAVHPQFPGALLPGVSGTDRNKDGRRSHPGTCLPRATGPPQGG